MTNFDVLIVGAGPCGIKASILLKEAGFEVAIIEKGTPGGKVNIAPRVDNYPGEHQILGPDLAYKLFEKLIENKIKIIGDSLLNISKDKDFILECEFAKYTAKAVLIATGTQEKHLDILNEDKFFGHGLSYCALCDGHFFRGKDIISIGSDSHALTETLYLKNLAKNLYFVTNLNETECNSQLFTKITEGDSVKTFFGYSVKSINGNDKVESITIHNKDKNDELTLSVDGVFPLIGQIPNTQFVKNKEILNNEGNIVVNKEMMTQIPGLFAAGDVIEKTTRQIYLAEKDAVIAAESIKKYLYELK